MAYVVLILSSLRGGIFLLTGLPPLTNIFFTITMVNIAFAVLPSRLFYYIKNHGELNTYLKLLIINVIFGLIWCIAEITIFGYRIGPIRIFLFYFIVPFCVLSFIRAKDSYITATIYFIAIIVSISCIIQFIISNFFPGPPIGLQIMRGPLMAIIPDFRLFEETGVMYSHVGPLYRAHGITGHYHDSGNILTMASVYCVGHTLYKKTNIFTIFLSVVILLGLLSTLSIANIFAAIIGITIISLFSYRGLFKRIFIIVVIGYALLFNSTFQSTQDQFRVTAIDVFSSLNLETSGGKMEAMLNVGSSDTSERIISMLFGHERSSGISNMGYYSEISFVIMLMEFGIVTFILLMMVLCFPIYIYFISNKKLRNEMWIPFVTVCTGILTLWHYGSLLRSTSIFLFFAFYSMVIKKYSAITINTKNNIILPN